MASALLQFADEALVHAAEARGLGLAEIEPGEQPPQPDGRVADERLLDLAEPADEQRREPARNAVGQQEIEVLLREQPQHLGS
jgi:hypothetical protein